jgi:signal transduction histidine kinase
MKKFSPYYFILLASLLTLTLSIVSCDDSDDSDIIIQNGGVSLYDLNKDIIQVNVTNTATGLRTVFNTMLSDSTSRAHLCQAFVNDARFFNDNSGYFFIETLDEAWVVAHINQEWIGTSRINAQDLNGKYHVQELVSTVENIGYGFVEYFFINPASGEAEDKLSFVTGMSPAEWFIGAGLYNSGEEQYYEAEEANKLLVKEITQTMAKGISGIYDNIYPEESERVEFSRNFIDHIKFFEDQSGYFFILDFDGLSIAHGAQEELQGQNLWNIQDTQGNYVIRGLADVAQNNAEGGYYEYYWENPSTGNEEPKTSYVIQIPDTNYFIGAGVYLE